MSSDVDMLRNTCPFWIAAGQTLAARCKLKQIKQFDDGLNGKNPRHNCSHKLTLKINDYLTALSFIQRRLVLILFLHYFCYFYDTKTRQII